MEFTGIFLKYPVNRPLTEQERAQQLKQGQRLNVEPLYQLSVIKMNSAYLESVDKWFGWKGVLTGATLAFMALFVGGFGWGGLDWLLQGLGVVPTEQDRGEMLASGEGMLACVGLVIWGLSWVLRKDSFAYTHYPMRFDRKARMVHVFRPNGTTLTVSWDKVFFTIGSLPRWREWEVRGHVLKSDGVTVEETFPLSFVGTFDPSSESFDPQRVAPDDYLRAHWEFIRRYMEEGPQAVTGQVQFCMPISKQKESFANGIERVCANIAGAPVVVYWMFWPFCMIVSVFRGFAMLTSKIPHFPPPADRVVGRDRGRRSLCHRGRPQRRSGCPLPGCCRRRWCPSCRPVQGSVARFGSSSIVPDVAYHMDVQCKHRTLSSHPEMASSSALLTPSSCSFTTVANPGIRCLHPSTGEDFSGTPHDSNEPAPPGIGGNDWLFAFRLRRG